MIRQIRTTMYDSRGYTDENSLAKLMLTSPDKISEKLTYLYGKEQESKFSFLSMTEGQGEDNGGIVYVNDVQYYWETMGLMPHTGEVVSYDATINTTPGINNTKFKVVFKDNFIIPQYTILAPDGETQCYVHGEPKDVSIGYEYTLEIKTTDPTKYVDLVNLQPGKHWVMLAPKVPESGSKGNRSNIMGTGRWVNQTSFSRYTKTIQGNLANKVTEIAFDGEDTVNGQETRLWINEEQRQFDMWMRTMINHDFYISEYNRNTNGEILLKDTDNGKPIPEGSGVRETIREIGNYDTYGDTLPLSKLKNTVGDIFWGETDRGTMEIVIHGGQGFGEDLHEAIMSDASANGFMQAVGEQFVRSGKDGYLSYGNTFTQYKTVTGHIITFKHDAMFDTGLLAELDIKNGNLHPRTNYPLSSHTGVFLDYSVYNGERNVRAVAMKGQSYIIGILKGLAPIPKAWGTLLDSRAISTDVDESKYEVKLSKSINIKNPRRCFILKCEI